MKPHRVVAFVHSPVSSFELGCVIEIFGRARPELGVDWYDFSVAAEAPGLVGATGGLAVSVGHGPELLEKADTIVIPSWESKSPACDFLLHSLRSANRRGARILSICSGAFLLAEAGLLDGRRAATHWMYAGKLQERFPAVRVDADVLYVDEDNIVTAAGSAAGLDMMLHIVRRDYGTAICNTVARRLNIPPWRDGGQSQFAQRPVPEIKDSRLSEVIAWMRLHSTEEISIGELAQRSAMSARTFFRRFREATGQTPYDWLISERVAVAKELLESCRLSMDQVAFDSGFGAPETLRHHFKRIVGCTPVDYRQRFCSPNLSVMAA